MRKKDEIDWRDALEESFESGRELCHGGCGDRAQMLRLTGRHVGAWCRECWREVAYGAIPRPTTKRRS